MKVIIFCVNYNSYDELNVYLDSIELATNVLEKTDDITVCIADNSIKVKELDTSKYNQITVKQYITNQNLGYFGGIMHLRDELINELDDFNYFVISNVDLKLKNDFFLKLKKEVIAEDIGCIAPSIYSIAEGIDRNPKVINRYELKKLKILRLMYKYPIINQVYTKIFYKKRRDKIQNYPNGYIYAPHGSFILFTNAARQFIKDLKYPVFLFGEEIYIAEKLDEMHLKVYYNNNLIVEDMDHVSTGKMKSKEYYKYNYLSIDMIIKEFYNEENRENCV